jgi:AbrB family looped-hinge helix DNA binding protein
LQKEKNMITEIARIGKRGNIVIPAALRRKYGLEEGSQIVVEPVPEGLLLRPVVTLPVEIYTRERKAEFLLNNAITSEDYAIAVEQVREMGLDPKKIPHRRIGEK